MSLTRVKVWNAGDILTASDLNTEFNNIINNIGTFLSTPLTSNLDFNNNVAQNFRLEVLAATQSSSAAKQGRLYYQSAEAGIHVDTGTLIARVPTLGKMEAGDIPVATNSTAVSGATTYGSLRATGVSTGNLLTMTSGGPTWLAPPTSAVYTDQLTGLGSTPQNSFTIQVAAGAAASDESSVASRVLMQFASAFNCLVSAPWAAGNGGGSAAKLDSAQVAASSSYHCFLINGASGTDVIFTGAASPALPAGYNLHKRRIFSFRTTASKEIVPYVQDQSLFQLATPFLITGGANPGTLAQTLTLTNIPTGFKFVVRVHGQLNSDAADTNNNLLYSDLNVTDRAAGIGTAGLGNILATAGGDGVGEALVQTNTSAQIRARLSISNASTQIITVIMAWIDSRGQG